VKSDRTGLRPGRGQLGYSRYRILGAVLLTAAMVLSACGDGDDDGEGSSGSTPEPAQSESEGSSGSTPEAEQGESDASSGSTPEPDQGGGTLTIAMGGGGSAETIDPHFTVFSRIDQARSRALFDQLVVLDPDGKPEFGIVESMQPNEDATVWTIRLREGAVWHDGRPVTADDLAASIKRASDPDAGSSRGWGPIDREGITKVDDLTVDVRFNTPNSVLIENLASVGRAAVVPSDFDPENPIGSGPFAYESFTPGERSVFVRNDDYWGDLAKVETLEIISMDDADARVNSLLSGQADIVEGIPTGQVGQVEESANLLQSEGGLALVFTMRTDTPPFDDNRVRRAIRLVADRQQMVDTVLAGRGVVGNDLLGRLEPCGSGDVEQIERDVEQAKALLAEAGYPDGLTVELSAADLAPGLMDAAQVLAQQAKDAGIEITVNRLDNGAFLDNWGEWTFATDYYSEWAAFSPYASSAMITEARVPITRFNNAEFDALYSDLLSTTEPSERCAMINEMQSIIHEEGGYLLWGFANYVDGYSDAVGGLESSGVSSLGGYRFNDVYLTE
jgi:peptide/nickel transport system substrate-binding protein